MNTNNKPVIFINNTTLKQLSEFFNSWNKEVFLKNEEILISRGIKNFEEFIKSQDDKNNIEEILDGIEFVELKLPFDLYRLKLDTGDGFEFLIEVEKQDERIRISFLDIKPDDFLDSDTEYYFMNREVFPLFNPYYWLESQAKVKNEGIIAQKIYPYFMDCVVYSAFFYELCKEDMVEVLQPDNNNNKPKNNSSKKKKKKSCSFRRVIIPKIKKGKRAESTKINYSKVVHTKKKTVHYVKDEWEREGCWCCSKNGKMYYRRGGICRRGAKSKNIEIILKPNRVKEKKET